MSARRRARARYSDPCNPSSVRDDAAGAGGRTGEARIRVEAAARSQPHEDPARPSLKSPLQLHGIVAGVEDEQRDSLFFSAPDEQPLHLLDGGHVGVLQGMDAQRVHRSRPALADEVELGDELVGPPGDDGLAGRVARRMVVVAAFGATLRVRAIPHAHVHGKDGRSFASSEWVTGEQLPQGFGVDPSSVQSGIKAPPAASMRRLEAQVNGRGDDVGGEDGVGELEESVGPAVETFVE